MRNGLIILVLSVAVYANSLGGGFVSDDIPTIEKNVQIGQVFASRSLGSLSNVLIYKVAGLNPFAYHLANIIIHAINSILVFYFLLIFFKTKPSLWGALLFAVHPIHTEAVSWISGRPYMLLATFLLASFLLYQRATSENKLKAGLYLASLFLYILGPFTSWFALCYPGMIILFDFTYNKWRKNWKLWLPYILVVPLWFLFRNYAIVARLSSLQIEMGSPGKSNLIFNLAYSLFAHMGLLLWPIRLTLYHEPLSISLAMLKLEIAALFVIVCFLPFIFKRAKAVFFALGVFFLFLSPTYSPVAISWVVAERYLYLPSVAFVMLIAYFLQKRMPGIVLVILISLISAYSVRTIIRNNDWRDRASLWRATVKVSPLSPRAHNNMGDIYGLEGDLKKAARSFQRAIELRPNYADAYHNLGNTYRDMGKTDAAIDSYKKAISINPRLYQSHHNLAAIYYNRGDSARAKEHLRKALEIRQE